MRKLFLLLLLALPTHLFAAPAGIAPTVLSTHPTNLKGYWKCDEVSGTTLHDSSGNGKDLTITGTIKTNYWLGELGLSGSAFRTDGAVGYASRTDSVIPSLDSQNFTFLVLLKGNSSDFGSVTNALAITNSASTNNRAGLGQNASSLTQAGAAVRGNGAINVISVNGGTAFNGSWHVLALRRNGTTYDLFVDGVNVGTATNTITTGSTCDRTSLMHSLQSASTPFAKGSVQHAAIWNTNLSDGEILALAQSATFTEGTEAVKIGTGTHNIVGPSRINWIGTTLDFTGAPTIGLSGNPGGSDGQFQYNNAGGFGGVAGLTLGGGLITADSSVFYVRDVSDPTKRLGWSLTSVPTGTTETIIVPNTANPVLVVPTAGASNQFVTNIGSTGAQGLAQPSFSNLSGNIAVSQMNSGTNADSSHFWRGDNTWSTITTGGTVTNIATTSPITGGPITTTGTIAFDPSVDLLMTTPQTISANNNTNNATTQMLSLNHNTTGTPAIGLGTGIQFAGESSTTTNRTLGNVNMNWSTITDATRTSYMDFQVVNSATTGAGMRLHGVGGLSVGSGFATNPGAGIVNAHTGFWVADAAPAVRKALISDGSKFAADDITDGNASLAVKPAVTVVAVANLTLSGEQTIDGQLTSASTVLATAQTTGSENGPWVTASGAWTRPTWYSSGSTTQAPRFLTTFVRLGTTYQGSTWRMTTASVTIDTTATTWAQTPISLASSNVTGTLPAANVTNPLNQNTTGSAATITTPRNLWGEAFNGSAAIGGAIELGTAGTTDTTFDRSSAGHGSIEGSVIGLASDNLGFFTASTSAAIGVGSIELGHATDTTVARSSAGHISVEGSVVGLASNDLSFFTTSTSNAIGVGTIELGHATDTTLSRSAAGVLAVEGVKVLATNSTSGTQQGLIAVNSSSGAVVGTQARATGNSNSGTPGTAICSITAGAGNQFVCINGLATQSGTGNSQITFTITYSDSAPTTFATTAATAQNVFINDAGFVSPTGQAITAHSTHKITGVSAVTLGNGTGGRVFAVSAVEIPQ